MSKVGAQFLDYLDVPTMSALLRVSAFSFIPRAESSMTALQRYRVYTLSEDIEWRLKTFNTAFDVDSSLKLYDLRRAKAVAVEDCLKVMMANGLSLDHRFRGKEEGRYSNRSSNRSSNRNSRGSSNSNKDCEVVMDLKKGMVPAARVLMDGCKQLNVWSSNTDFEDLSSGYLVDFAEFQRQKGKGAIPVKKPPISAVGGGTGPKVDEQEGQRYLDKLSRLVVNGALAGRDNMRSVHCCYLKVLREREYEVHSWLWVFVELKENDYAQDMAKGKKRNKGKKRKEKGRQFMVWKGQCGCTKL